MLGLVFLIRFLFDTYCDDSLLVRIIELIVVVFVGIISYEFFLLLFKDKSIMITKELINKVLKRNKKNNITSN